MNKNMCFTLINDDRERINLLNSFVEEEGLIDAKKKYKQLNFFQKILFKQNISLFSIFDIFPTNFIINF